LDEHVYCIILKGNAALWRAREGETSPQVAGEKMKFPLRPPYAASFLAFGGIATPVLSNELDVEITETGGDGQIATCVSSRVGGLDPNGDGFLAIRSGPGTQYRKTGELHNGEVVYIYEQRGQWAGVVYRTDREGCSATQTRTVTHPNRGWVHSNWLRDLAG
jgi:hypothetical protein